MRRSVLILAPLSVLLLGACADGGSNTTTPAASSSSHTSPGYSKSNLATDPTPVKSKAAPLTDTPTTTSEDAAPEVISEDGGTPGGGLPDEEFSTKDYLQDTWAAMEAADDDSTGMTCLVFRSEPDAELELGEDAVLDSIDAEVAGIDREEARDFFDTKCPSVDEIEAASQEGDQ